MRSRGYDEVLAESNAIRVARAIEDGQGAVVERDRNGRWTTVDVGRGDADRCEDLP